MTTFQRAGRQIRVVVFNDSPTVRLALKHVLSRAPDITVVGEASDGRHAEELVELHRPDLVLMDAVMPHVDGFAATRAIMAKQPVPIVIISSVLDPRDSKVVFETLSAGALCVVETPPGPQRSDFDVKAMALIQLVRSMASVRLPGSQARVESTPPGTNKRRSVSSAVAVIGIVASTGGPGVLLDLLLELPALAPPILVVQHLPPGFAPSFARWLRDRTRRSVIVPESNAALEPSVVYIAPSGRHMGITKHGAIDLDDSPPIRLFRPSGNFLLESLAKSVGKRGVGVVMTGMGDDGALGALALRQAGGKVAVQDEVTSIVYGMPRATLETAGADAVLPAQNLAGWLTLTYAAEAGGQP